MISHPLLLNTRLVIGCLYTSLSEEISRLRKLSQPWHGPYWIISKDDPDVTVTRVYFPDHPPLQVHQLSIKSCPVSLPCGYYFYGKKRSRPRRPPKWIEKLLSGPPVGSKDEQDRMKTGSRSRTASGGDV